MREGSTLVWGRNPSLGLTLSDPQISNRHLTLTVRDARLVLSDLGSTNGTVVGGHRVQDCELTHGELITLGGAELRVEALTAPPGLPPPLPAIAVSSPAAVPPALGNLRTVAPSKTILRRLPLWTGLGVAGLIISLAGVLWLTNRYDLIWLMFALLLPLLYTVALENLKRVAREGGNIFAELLETVRVCSLGQISNALYEVGGQYRRSM